MGVATPAQIAGAAWGEEKSTREGGRMSRLIHWSLSPSPRRRTLRPAGLPEAPVGAVAGSPAGQLLGPRGWRLIARAAALVVIALASALAACGPSAAPGPVSAGALRRLGPTDPARVLRLTLMLAGQAPEALDRTLADLTTPAAASYRHFLSPDQFAARFGATPATATRVEGALRAAGLTVTGGSPDHLLVRARGTVRQVDRLFGVAIQDYQTADGRRFYAAPSAPRLPPELAGAVTAVLGLENLSLARPAGIMRAAQAGGGLTPADLAQAYDLAPLQQAGLNGSDQTLALAEIDTFTSSDIDTYDRAFGITAAPVEEVKVGGAAAAPDTFSEAALDIEVIHAIAPRAHLIAYEGGSDTASLAQLFDQIVSEHRAQVVSISLGLCERYILNPDQAPSDLQDGLTAAGQSFFSALDTTFREADALGMSVLVATGDTGAYGCNRFDPSDHTVGPSAPATSPYVTAVGGTALFTNADGSYSREYGWEGPLEGAGGGGGLSLQYRLPTWQTGPGVANQDSNGMRQVPDVAANADPLTGYAIYDSSGPCQGQECWGVVGGTSAAAPLWAALIALANQAGAQHGLRPAGFLNPALYRLGSGAVTPRPYHDIAAGGNLFYQATAGWDYSTGWGSPDGNALVRALLADEQRAGQSGG
jgi:subtilase family serine protease